MNSIQLSKLVFLLVLVDILKELCNSPNLDALEILIAISAIFVVRNLADYYAVSGSKLAYRLLIAVLISTIANQMIMEYLTSGSVILLLHDLIFCLLIFREVLKA